MRREGVLELIEDTSHDIVLAVLKDWGRNLAELGQLVPPDFFRVLRQCFEAGLMTHTPTYTDFQTTAGHRSSPCNRDSPPRHLVLQLSL